MIVGLCKSLPGRYKLFACILIVISFTVTCTNNKLKQGGNNFSQQDTANWPASFGFGRTATTEEIEAIDIDIMPDGTGLPSGSGNAFEGKIIYTVKCAACHGATGREGPFNRLVGPMGDTSKAKTIGNYWPYSTTVFDYIRRAMPQTAPGSLNDNEVYSLTAYLLYANKIIDSTVEISADNLAKIEMPAKKFFVKDDRHGGSEIR